MELDGHLTDERRTSHSSGDEENGAATSQLGKSLENRESQTELSQSGTSEMANSLTRAERDLDSITQQRNETEASLHRQISHLETQLTESRSLSENEPEALTVQCNETEASLHTQISHLQTQITEMTQSRSLAEKQQKGELIISESLHASKGLYYLQRHCTLEE